MNSLDPRVNRLPKAGQQDEMIPTASMDQFGTFEVFVQPREGKAFQHEGIVHAPNSEMAYVLAKETFTRRFLCHSLSVVDTRHVYVSPMTQGSETAYDLVPDTTDAQGHRVPYEIYHLLKRGKQHIHAGTFEAASPQEAMSVAKKQLNNPQVYNIWAIRTTDIRYTTPDEQDLWNTLPEKKFRDASDYKGGDKLKEFLERHQP